MCLNSKSSKFLKKITYCSTLTDLGNFLDLKNLNIPEEVRHYDSQLKANKQNEPLVNAKPAEYSPYQQFKVPLEQ